MANWAYLKQEIIKNFKKYFHFDLRKEFEFYVRKFVWNVQAFRIRSKIIKTITIDQSTNSFNDDCYRRYNEQIFYNQLRNFLTKPINMLEMLWTFLFVIDVCFYLFQQKKNLSK